jgi:tRNA nucleotidyltransferase/poly(A) polymerase
MSRKHDHESSSQAAHLAPYAGRWVALMGSKIIGQGGTPQQALQAAKAARPKETPLVVFVPAQNQISFSAILDRVAAALPAEIPIYLVGGAVRDSMLGKRVHDLDFVLPGDVMKHARQIAKVLGCAFFPLDEERDAARLILVDQSGQRNTLDFAAYRGPDLESDLRGRDFTINAMAVDLRSHLALYDPLGGASDLREKLIRACSPNSLSDDPVRILRAIRLAASLDFRILPDTRSLMRRAISGLSHTSPERLRDELFKILSGSQPSTSIRALDLLGALPYVLPELIELKGVEQSPPHLYEVWEHTLGVLRQLENILHALRKDYDQDAAANMSMGLLVMRLGRYREQLEAHFQNSLNPERNLRGLLFFAALYHDIAKPGTRQVEESGRIRFLRHEQVGEEMVAVRSRELKLSNAETGRVKAIVRHHLRPLLLAQSQSSLTRRAIYRFFKATGPAGVEVCLLSLADVLATYGAGLTTQVWSRHLDVVRGLLEAWWEYPQESVSPADIINGHELMDQLGIEPGPLIGRLLDAIRERQAMGAIQTKEQALSLAKELLEEWYREQDKRGDDLDQG